jgi:lipopolysaccharide export LptBFGC system permease protein LptF
MKIWCRYLFRLLSKTFLFLIVCIFIIYTIVDLSMHGVRFFSHGTIHWAELFMYYVHNFAKHLGFFFPLTLLLSSLKVLLDLNTHHELVALQMAGLSQRKLLFPFFAFAALISLSSYANHEWFSPDAQESADSFRHAHTKHRKKEQKKPHLFNADLQDKSELVYQAVHKNELFDVFWIKNSKDIWHMKYLKTDPLPEGRFVDHFQRNKQGKFEKTESFSHHVFPGLVFDANVNLQAFIPFENRSISTLFQQSFRQNSERHGVLCHLHYKLASPLLSFIILLSITPIAMRFNRSLPTFLIVASSLFAFIGFMTILEGMLILGENQVIPSILAIWSPMLAIFLLVLPQFLTNHLAKKKSLR